MTYTEFQALPMGSEIKAAGARFLKVSGWGRGHDALLLNVETFFLYAPEAIIAFEWGGVC